MSAPGMEPPEAAGDAGLRTRFSTVSRALQTAENDLEVLTAALAESQDQLLALYDLSGSLRNLLDLEKTLHLLAQSSLRLLKAGGTFVLYARAGEAAQVYARPHGWVDGTAVLSVVDGLDLSDGPLLLENSSNIQKIPPGLRLPGGECTALYLVPVLQDADRRVLLGVVFTQPLSSLGPDMKLARAIVYQVGLHLENVFLHEEAVGQARMRAEMDLARRIQLQLLPQSAPKMDGLEIGGRISMMEQVGGDFYDYVVSQNRPFTFSVGDVAGKGLAAALLASMTHTVIHSAARFSSSPSPAAILQRANQDLVRQYTDVGLFVTVFIGQFIPGESRLVYANSGHSPVIFCPAGGRPVLLQADTPPLGVLDEIEPGNHSLLCGAGDVLVVASDGFSEARNPAGMMLGTEGLMALVEQYAHLPAYEIVQALYAALDFFRGDQPQADDQTLLVIKKGGKSVDQIDLQIELSAGYASLDAVRDAIARLVKKHHPGPGVEEWLYAAQLAVHEACVNIIQHAYAGQNEGQFSVGLILQPEARCLTVCLVDSGQSFDPAGVAEPDLDNLQEHGYGLFLIRSLMDEVSYTSAGRRNTLVLKKCW